MVLQVPKSDQVEGAGAPEKIEITPVMVTAGAAVLYELEGEVSKEALAREVYLAMRAAQDP